MCNSIQNYIPYNITVQCFNAHPAFSIHHLYSQFKTTNNNDAAFTAPPYIRSCLINPISITACNRTLYGDTGKTYELEIHKPKAFPFVCHLNFSAPGGPYGDIIQVRLRTTHTHIGDAEKHTNMQQPKSFSPPTPSYLYIFNVSGTHCVILLYVVGTFNEFTFPHIAPCTTDS